MSNTMVRNPMKLLEKTCDVGIVGANVGVGAFVSTVGLAVGVEVAGAV